MDEQSAQALLAGNRCILRTTSSGLPSSTFFCLREEGVLPDDVLRASPGFDSMIFLYDEDDEDYKQMIS